MTTAVEETTATDKKVEEMDLDEYKAHVQNVAYTQAAIRGWCSEDFDGVMAQLGLPPLPLRQYHKVVVPVTGTVELEYFTHSEEAAKAQAADAIRQYFEGGSTIRIKEPKVAGDFTVTVRE